MENPARHSDACRIRSPSLSHRPPQQQWGGGAGLTPVDVTVTPTSVTVIANGTCTPVFLSLIGSTCGEVTGTSTARSEIG